MTKESTGTIAGSRPRGGIAPTVFEQFEAGGSPNTTFWNAVATGAQSTSFPHAGTFSWLMTNQRLNKTNLATQKLYVSFYMTLDPASTATTVRIGEFNGTGWTNSPDFQYRFATPNRFLSLVNSGNGSDFAISLGTKYLVELEVDVASDTLKMWIDGTLRKTITPGCNGGNCTYLSIGPQTVTTLPMYIDDLSVYVGFLRADVVP